MLWLVIPAYNEEKRIGAAIAKARKHCANIVVVDDGSKDSTSVAAIKQDVNVLRHIVNLGKGAAAKTGCDYAMAHGAKNIILMDSDGQHDADDIPHFLTKLKDKDIVFGQRKFDEHMPFIYQTGNRLLDFLTYLLFGIKLTDTQCGYRAFSVEAYRKVRWKASDYAMESEMIANAGRHKLRYATVPIATVYADRFKGTTVFDGISIGFNMIFWRLRRGIL